MKGIVYTEFDNVAGPIIRYQTPANCLPLDLFDSVSDYIIVDKPLCGKLITGTSQCSYKIYT